ncbi:CDP-alcohol phosphatidyltransferase family protein [Aliiroseovarius sp. S1123]|jgi:phosphatidylglycerophosphate synthase|uniref:CDP-alcohol phosphatidyltransferase family protein n=1 Tax=unclassified Aliiroseovarius TaxID=2623558 RepID=UPI001FF2D0AC|nr:CDP-alcohol phosphatidyltransferase family protein [Aliiroseovarius sp. S1123]MCK0171559.1 CDP-alcohol phosphatidyltransferase family protein [Aliiroseovarius sp. S1123]
MLDAYARKLIDPPLDRVGGLLARAGVGANAVTLVGLGLGLLAAISIVFGQFTLALWLVLASRVADGLDGAIARASTRTDFGGYLDITADFAFYGAIPMAFILYDPATNGIAGAVLLLSFYVNGASFLGYAILAAKKGLDTRAQGVKSLYYSNGILEGTETILFFVILCLAPRFFMPLAWLFAIACFATAILRVWGAYQAFGPTLSDQQETK